VLAMRLPSVQMFEFAKLCTAQFYQRLWRNTHLQCIQCERQQLSSSEHLPLYNVLHCFLLLLGRVVLLAGVCYDIFANVLNLANIGFVWM